MPQWGQRGACSARQQVPCKLGLALTWSNPTVECSKTCRTAETLIGGRGRCLMGVGHQH